MADDSAELVINGESRRVAMDIMKLESNVGDGGSNESEAKAQIDGEIHDQEDLSSTENAVLKIDGVGEFKVNFYSPTRFRGEFIRPWSSELIRELGRHSNLANTANE